MSAQLDLHQQELVTYVALAILGIHVIYVLLTIMILILMLLY